MSRSERASKSKSENFKHLSPKQESSQDISQAPIAALLCRPQPIPEVLKGKPLFPMAAWKDEPDSASGGFRLSGLGHGVPDSLQ